jgi:hypothetical protein
LLFYVIWGCSCDLHGKFGNENVHVIMYLFLGLNQIETCDNIHHHMLASLIECKMLFYVIWRCSCDLHAKFWK